MGRAATLSNRRGHDRHRDRYPRRFSARWPSPATSAGTIALVNELARFANDLGINIWEAIEAADTKRLGFMKFTPVPGVGHCLPIDPSYVSWRVEQSLGQSFRFVEFANDVNEHIPDYEVSRLITALNDRELPVNGRRVLLLGLAYKKDTGDARGSPSVVIAAAPRALGAELRGVDPHVLDPQVPVGVTLVKPEADEVTSADAVLVLVDHDEFDLDLVRSEATYVLDTRNVVKPAINDDRL